MSHKEDFEEEWVVEANREFSEIASGEFARYKQELKRKAGLFDPWYMKFYKKMLRWFKS